MSYQSRYTWQDFISVEGHDIHRHTDNSVSLIIRWDGLHTRLKTESSIDSAFQNIYACQHAFSSHEKIFFERHFIRDFNNDLPQRYVEYGEKNIVRNKEIGMFFREEIAETVSSLAMKNQVFIVLVIPAKTSPIYNILPNKEVTDIVRRGKELLQYAKRIKTFLSGSTLLDRHQYWDLMHQCYKRESTRNNHIPKLNERFTIRDSFVTKPQIHDDCLQVQNTYIKPLLLTDYPDAHKNWFDYLADFSSCELHISQVYQMVDSDMLRNSSILKQKQSDNNTNQAGSEHSERKVEDISGYRTFVDEYKLASFKNCYMITLYHTDHEQLIDAFDDLRNILGSSVVFADSSPEMMMAVWRYSQIGQGYRSKFLRPDHTWQIDNMAPIITFDEGEKEELQMLRITNDLTPVIFNYPKGGANHSITGAKSNSGKTVESISQVLELYPLGYDFYIMEYGPCTKWVVEGFGGDYIELAPDTVLSPLPACHLFYENEGGDERDDLIEDILNPTVESLMPLLSQGHQNIAHHIEAQAHVVMDAMYKGLGRDFKGCPPLSTFLEYAYKTRDEQEGIKKESLTALIDNLDSFLTGQGKHFAKSDSIDFTKNIIGTDFMPLMQSNKIATFMLTFATLRFKQLAFSNSSPARILTDELHEFARIDPEQVKVLGQQLTRMGRKENASWSPISQEILDANLGIGVLNQISHRNLMFTGSGHEEVRDLFKLNDSVVERWKEYRDPDSKGPPMNFRQNIRVQGKDAFDLYLKYPDSVLDTAHSSPKALETKKMIALKESDFFKRLELFQRMKTA